MADACVDCGRTDTVFFTSGCSGCKTVSEWPAMPIEQPRDEPTTIEKLEAVIKQSRHVEFWGEPKRYLTVTDKISGWRSTYDADEPEAAINTVYGEMMGE